MIDYQHRIGIPGCQLSNLLQTPPTQQGDREGVTRDGRENPVDARINGVADTLLFIMIRMATVPVVAAQSAIVSATAGSVGSTGLINANQPGCAA